MRKRERGWARPCPRYLFTTGGRGCTFSSCPSPARLVFASRSLVFLLARVFLPERLVPSFEDASLARHAISDEKRAHAHKLLHIHAERSITVAFGPHRWRNNFGAPESWRRFGYPGRPTPTEWQGQISTRGGWARAFLRFRLTVHRPRCPTGQSCRLSLGSGRCLSRFSSSPYSTVFVLCS